MPTNGQFMINKIAVGTLNPVKIEAVRMVAQQIWPQVSCIGCRVDSGVSEQPVTDEEAIRGAVNRAHAAREHFAADLGIGLEGNTVDTDYGMFLSAWVAVVKGGDHAAETVGLASSGRLLLPEAIAGKVRSGDELGPLIDRISGQVNTKQKSGAIGVLTGGYVERKEALMHGVWLALARYVSPGHYFEG